ncbi:MAG: ribosome assembly RNA-binding protein YhbY [Clostridiaceae bacterium]|jgi:RNA-binding protein|nr:ribosome assembly RNA-binding protein YhbY [Clostridiaceae bacterium]
MLTGKQRSNLRAQANGIEPIVQIGKGGVSENLMKQLADVLYARELVKITVHKNAEFTAKEIANDLAVDLEAEPVAAIGNKVILYKRSKKDGINHVEF